MSAGSVGTPKHTDTFQLQPLLWLVGSYVLTRLSTEFLHFGSFLILFVLLLFVLYAVRLFSNLVRHKLFTALSFAAPCIAAILIYITQDQIIHLTDRVKLRVFRSQYAECIKSASDLGHGAVFGVCERYDWTDHVEAIVYDFSDEISLPTESRSQNWKRVVLSLQKKAPFGIVGFRSHKISGHFYKLDFYNEDLPTF